MHGLVADLNRVNAAVQPLDAGIADDLAYIRDNLQSLLDHYEAVLAAHNIALPY